MNNLNERVTQKQLELKQDKMTWTYSKVSYIKCNKITLQQESEKRDKVARRLQNDEQNIEITYHVSFSEVEKFWSSSTSFWNLGDWEGKRRQNHEESLKRRRDKSSRNSIILCKNLKKFWGVLTSSRNLSDWEGKKRQNTRKFNLVLEFKWPRNKEEIKEHEEFKTTKRTYK